MLGAGLYGLPRFRPAAGIGPKVTAPWPRGAVGPSGLVRAWQGPGRLWQRAQPYRYTPYREQVRGAADALARQSYAKYLRVAVGAGKLDPRDTATRESIQGMLRAIQLARHRLDDMQVRARAAELRTVTDYLRRPEVVRLRAVPSSSGGRTPDLVITRRVNGRLVTERVEITAITQGTRGGRRSAAVPPPLPVTVPDISAAIVRKLERGQLRAVGGIMARVPQGGALVIHARTGGPSGAATAAAAVEAIQGRLRAHPEVRRIDVALVDRTAVFTRDARGRFVPAGELPRGPAASPVRPRPRRRRRGRRR